MNHKTTQEYKLETRPRGNARGLVQMSWLLFRQHRLRPEDADINNKPDDKYN